MFQPLIKPFQAFIRGQALAGLLLALCVLWALLWANSPSAVNYEIFWNQGTHFHWDNGEFAYSWKFWINEAFMSLFFLLVGLEIKREFLQGELSTPQQANLPILGALGGMIVPAFIYMLLNPPGSPYSKGWGIPMVTDIAFAVGALSLLGNRIPTGLKVFLVALAIVDDIGAILIIALFYSQYINLGFLAMAGAILFLGWWMNRAGLRKSWPYCLLGLPLWLALWHAGIHPTIGGVLLAGIIPAATPQVSRDESGSPMPPAMLEKWEANLQPWVTYLILPLFALANAGVVIPISQFAGILKQPLTAGVIAGLFLGKPIGISIAAWLGVKAGWAALPTHVNWRQICAVGVLSGIGFTMSLFITLLAFSQSDSVVAAKLGILVASSLAALVGMILLRINTL